MGGAWPKMRPLLCPSTAGQQVVNANSNSNNTHDWPLSFLRHLSLLRGGFCSTWSVSLLRGYYARPHKPPLGSPVATSILLHLVRKWELLLLLHSTAQSSCKSSRWFTKSMELTMSPIQRLMHNLFPDVASPGVHRAILFLESLSGFPTLSMWHLVCPSCGIQAQDSQNQMRKSQTGPLVHGSLSQ